MTAWPFPKAQAYVKLLGLSFKTLLLLPIFQNVSLFKEMFKEMEELGVEKMAKFNVKNG